MPCLQSLLPSSRMLSLYMHHSLYVFYLIPTILAQGQIAQFLNWQCTQQSLINATVPLNLDTCLVTSGAIGIVPQSVPPCATGSATLQVYKDKSCARPDTDPEDVQDNCYNNGNFLIPAVMFICGSVADGNSRPTSTSTVTAGSVLVPVAKATGATTTTTPSGHSSQTTTDSNGLVTSDTPTSSASDPSQTDASSGGGDLGSGLSHRNQIILGVILPVGSLIIALLTWLCPKPWNRGRDGGHFNDYRMLEYPGVNHMPHWHRG